MPNHQFSCQLETFEGVSLLRSLRKDNFSATKKCLENENKYNFELLETKFSLDNTENVLSIENILKMYPVSLLLVSTISVLQQILEEKLRWKKNYAIYEN